MTAATGELPAFVAVVGGGGVCGWRNCGNREAHNFTEAELDAAAIIRVILQELARIFAALAKTFTLVGEPGPALFDDAFFDGKIEQVAFARDAFAVHDVELRFTERRSDLVFDDLHFGAASNHFVSIFNGSDSPHIHSNRRIKFQRAAPGSRFGITEHDTDFFADLVDKDEAGSGF